MDKKAQIERWFIQYSEDIYHFLVYYTGNADVEDLVQEVFIKALKGIHTFEQRSQPRTWLFTIARYTAIDFVRKKQLARWLPIGLAGQMAAKERTPDEWLGLAEERRELYQAISRLKPAYREVLIMRAIKEWSVKETAAVLGWSEAKVSVTLFRAMKSLEKKMNKTVGGVTGDVFTQ